VVIFLVCFCVYLNVHYCKMSDFVQIPKASQTQCIFCKERKHKTVGRALANSIYLRDGIVVDFDHYYLCTEHVHFRKKHEDLQFPKIVSKKKLVSQLQPKLLMNFLGKLRSHVSEAMKDKRFDIDTLTDEKFKQLTRFTRDQFEQILERAKIKNPYILLTFLVILKTGMSQRETSVLLGIPKSTISDYFNKALALITKNITEENFGLKNVPRNTLRSWATEAFVTAFPKAIAIWDGTYFYAEKAADFEVQKKTFSGQKHRNLFKEMVCVSPDGYFVDSFGLFFSDGINNDQALIEHIFSTDERVSQYFQKTDEFLVDRGFSRASIGHQLHFPRSIKKNQTQLSDVDANYSRKVTKFRYIIEAAFGRLKQFKFLKETISLQYTKNLHDIIRAAMVLINLFMGSIADDSMLVEEEVERIVSQEMKSNCLEHLSEVTKGWKKVAMENILIPEYLSKESIRTWALGPYAERLALSYINHSGFNLSFWSHRDHPDVYRVQGIPSRFTSGSKHRIWLQFGGDMNDVFTYCSCKSGSRVTGGCAHSIAVLTYLVEPDQKKLRSRSILSIAQSAKSRASVNGNVQDSVPNIRILIRKKRGRTEFEVSDQNAENCDVDMGGEGGKQDSDVEMEVTDEAEMFEQLYVPRIRLSRTVKRRSISYQLMGPVEEVPVLNKEIEDTDVDMGVAAEDFEVTMEIVPRIRVSRTQKRRRISYKIIEPQVIPVSVSDQEEDVDVEMAED
jgi:predicted XRE-type DNA-binding protein